MFLFLRMRDIAIGSAITKMNTRDNVLPRTSAAFQILRVHLITSSFPHDVHGAFPPRALASSPPLWPTPSAVLRLFHLTPFPLDASHA